MYLCLRKAAQILKASFFAIEKQPATIKQEFATSRHLEFNRWEGWGQVTIKDVSFFKLTRFLVL